MNNSIRICSVILSLAVLVGCVFCCAPKSKAANILSASFPYQEPNVWVAVSDGDGDNVAGGSELFYFDFTSFDVGQYGQSTISIQVYNSGSGDDIYFYIYPNNVPVYRVYNGQIQRMSSSKNNDGFWVVSSGFNSDISLAWGNHSDYCTIFCDSNYPVLDVYFTGQADIVEEFNKQNGIIQDGFEETNSWLETISNTLTRYLYAIDDYLFDLKVGINNIYTYLSDKVTQFFSDWRNRMWLIEQNIKNGFDSLIAKVDDIYQTLVQMSEDASAAADDAANKADQIGGTLDSASGAEDSAVSSGMGSLDSLPSDLSSLPSSLFGYSGTTYMQPLFQSPFIEPFLQLACIFMIIKAVFSGRWWKEA